MQLILCVELHSASSGLGGWARKILSRACTQNCPGNMPQALKTQEFNVKSTHTMSLFEAFAPENERLIWKIVSKTNKASHFIKSLKHYVQSCESRAKFFSITYSTRILKFSRVQWPTLLTGVVTLLVTLGLVLPLLYLTAGTRHMARAKQASLLG